jgi:hypothetical protein
MLAVRSKLALMADLVVEEAVTIVADRMAAALELRDRLAKDITAVTERKALVPPTIMAAVVVVLVRLELREAHHLLMA